MRVTKIEFEGYLAGVNTAAKPLSFDIDGAAKIALEAGESQTANVIPLLALGRSRLKVTIEVIDTATPEVGKKSRKKKTEPVDDSEPVVIAPQPPDLTSDEGQALIAIAEPVTEGEFEVVG